MTGDITRRGFMGASAATLGLALGAGAAEPAGRAVRVGVVGVGNRGTSLMRALLQLPGVEVPAVCDILQEHITRAQDIVEQAGRSRPEGYGTDDHAYEGLMTREDLDAVIIASPWQWHAPMAVSAMKHGKYAGVEVPATVSIEECWDLVNTSEETGVPCMMLENWSFRADNLAVLNMIRGGLLGEIVHCHCAHSHDCVGHWFFNTDGSDRWPTQFLVKYNRDQYPTHSLGPVLSWMDINCGDLFESLTSTATASRGINDYFARTYGPDHPNATREFRQGDIVTTTVKTRKGRSVVINYDMQLPRPYDNRWLIQGTRGLYNEQRDAVCIVDRSPKGNEWEPFPPYMEEFQHAWWKNLAEIGGHGGTDYLELSLFVEAVRHGAQTPIDVYDSVVMSCIVPLSGDSIAADSAPVQVPDFTRGRWETRKPTFALET